ncbi:3-hydroxyisobutyrate dehydrogenase [Aureococcus anophagefferens]|nr:3-hydroxyisobutyrate dehydrogenase [Aureococcus anophagefferens]
MAAAKLGLVGLGNLGMEFGLRAVAASRSVVAHDASPRLALAGAARADSVGAVVAAAPTVVSVVPDDAAARAVADELLAAAAGRGSDAPPLLHVSCSTISPAASASLGGATRWRRLRRRARLRAAREHARGPGVLRRLRRRRGAPGARRDRRAGVRGAARAVPTTATPGAANVAKLCGNFLIAASIEALGESLALAEGHGVDREAVLAMLASTIFDCAIYRGYGGRVAGRDHAPGGFALHHGLKDVGLVQKAAQDARVPMPLGSLLVDQFTAASNDAALAGLDWSALGLHVSKNAGVDASSK